MPTRIQCRSTVKTSASASRGCVRRVIQQLTAKKLTHYAGGQPTQVEAPHLTDTQPGKPPARVVVQWQGPGTMAFDGRKAKGGPTITVDNTGKAHPGPVDTVLIALAACTTEDVLTILEKRRTPAARLEIQVEGNTLTLKGERKLENEEKRDGYHRIERTYGLRGILLSRLEHHAPARRRELIPVAWAPPLVIAFGGHGQGLYQNLRTLHAKV